MRISAISSSGSTDGVEQGIVVYRVAKRFAHDLLGQTTALSTLTGHTQTAANITQTRRPILHQGADLGIGDLLAKTNVQRGGALDQWLTNGKLVQMRMIVNHLDSSC